MSQGIHKTDPSREWTDLWAELFIINNTMMTPVKQRMVFCGVSCICVTEAVFCRWHQAAGPPSSAKTLTLCGSGPSVSFNHPNVEATRLTALHRRVMPLPRALINKHTTSLGVPQVVSVNTLNGASLSDGSKEQPHSHRSSSLPQSFQISSILSNSLIHHFSLNPPTSHPSRGLPCCSTVQTGQRPLDLIPHSPYPAGTIRSLNTPGEKWACYTYTFFLLIPVFHPDSCTLPFKYITFRPHFPHLIKLYYSFTSWIFCNLSHHKRSLRMNTKALGCFFFLFFFSGIVSAISAVTQFDIYFSKRHNKSGFRGVRP